MKIIAISGKSFGDEGKGLTTDYYARQAQQEGKPCLAVRHNGGAQAGHTVELPHRRFVFHQLSSGSFRNADTLWADSFLPDLFKLREEAGSFRLLHGALPRIYAFTQCRSVIVDDVLLNMAIETHRGFRRHGSCGMGINEAVVRSSQPDYCLSLGTVLSLSGEELYRELRRIRQGWQHRRLSELGISLEQAGEYGELLSSDTVLYRAAEEMKRACELLLPTEECPSGYDILLLEGAQGLLLDETNEAFAPHLTSSRTGLTNPLRFCRKYCRGQFLEAVYVSRSYVTRHGNGPLPHEELFDKTQYRITDHTNQPNEWQGSLRFAVHGTAEEFCAPILKDLAQSSDPVRVSLMITHLNETNGAMLSSDQQIPSAVFREQCRRYLPVSSWIESYSPVNG